MAYSTPPTFVSGNTLTAAQLNVLSNDIAYLKTQADSATFAGAALTAGSQTIPNSSSTNIVWTAEPLATGGDWWTSGANVVVPAAVIPTGYSYVVLEIAFASRFDANGTGVRQASIYLDGTLVEETYSASAISGETTPVALTVWAYATAGQVITAAVAQSSGGNLACSHTSLHVKRIGGL